MGLLQYSSSKRRTEEEASVMQFFDSGLPSQLLLLQGSLFATSLLDRVDQGQVNFGWTALSSVAFTVLLRPRIFSLYDSCALEWSNCREESLSPGFHTQK
jgi:hypothetical protein